MKRTLVLALMVVAASCLGTVQPAMAETAHIAAPTKDSCIVQRPPVAELRVVRATPLVMATLVPSPSSNQRIPGVMLLAVGALIMGTLTTIGVDKDAQYQPGATLKSVANALIAYFRYIHLNGLASTTIATQPGCATATVTSKVKTAAATVLWCNGVAVALGASDNYWTLAPTTHLLTGMTRKYLLCSNAAGVASVVASSDAATAAGCLFAALPADGVAIVGQLTVANASGADFIPATTLLGAAGITATYIDNHDDSLMASLVNLVGN